VTPGPGHRQCTTYLWPGPGGTPLALPLTEGLGVIAAPDEWGMPDLDRDCDVHC